MKNILKFINDNAIVASFITLAISTIIQMIFRKSDRKYNEKQENRRNKKKAIENKAILYIDENVKNEISIPCVNVLMSDFNVKVTNDDVEFYYPNDILNKEKYKHLVFYVRNVDKASINQLDICVTSQKHNMICGVDNIEIYVKNKIVSYNYLYDRTILDGELIKIDISYLENSKILSMFNSELELIFRDSYGNFYAQPFFIDDRKLYEARLISYKEYKSYVTIDTAIECFKNPIMR